MGSRIERALNNGRILGLEHPYYPPGTLIIDYMPNESPVWVLLASFSLVLGITVATFLVQATRVNPGLRISDRAAICWFVLCGSLHCFFEGYYILHHEDLASHQSLFGQLWKEYALSDSRYLTSDPFMLCVEAITVVIWGPLCYAIAICIVRRSPLRHSLQIIMCVGHLFGCLLYYSTSLVELYVNDVSHSRPEPLYFWGYYVGFNFPWILVPMILLVSSVKAIRRAFSTIGEVGLALQKMRLMVIERESEDMKKMK